MLRDFINKFINKAKETLVGLFSAEPLPKRTASFHEIESYIQRHSRNDFEAEVIRNRIDNHI